MERLDLSRAASVAKTFEGWITVTARKIETAKPIPGSVALHEAAHVVAAGEIVMATIRPTGDALGTTQPVKMTAAAAAAPEALGHDGTGWDMFLTEHVLGVDPGTAKAAARSALAGRHDELHEVAILLEERGTIGQGDVNEARQNVSEKRQGIFPVQVEILEPGRKIVTFPTKSFRGVVKISDFIPSSAKAA